MVDEYEIHKWLLENQDTLKEKIKSLYRPHHLFPPSIQDVYITQYENQVIRIIQKELGSVFNLNNEFLHTTITKDFIKITCSNLLTI